VADIQSNIQVNLDATQALAQLKALQRQLAQFHTSIAASTAAAAKAQANLQNNLINSINATGKFSASLQQIKSTSEAFTESLEKNKFSTREYFRYAGGATKTFGRLFKSEFDTIQKVAQERVKTIQTQFVKMGRTASGSLKAIAIRPLTLDMENFATKAAIAAQKQQLFNQLLKQGSTNLLNFGKNTQWAGRQLMVGFTIPLTMLGVQAGKSFMALEKQAIRFKRVYGEVFTTADETDKALKNIELLAKEFTKYGIAVEKTMEMAADAAATGKMGADLTAQVAEATRLAVLGGVEQQQALETTISLTNAFGIAADDLNKKINFLNAVENQTILSIEDLTIAIPKAAPVVKQLGGNIEDLAFFMTAMKEGGINASEGANALKSGLAALINPTKKAKEFLQDLGISIDQIVESNKGDIKTTVLQFAQALDTLDPLNRARAIEQLFGKFQFSRLSTLFQNITKDGTQASRTLQLTSASVEELAILSERELKKIEDSTGTKFKKTLEDLKVSLVPLGEQFLKAVTPIAEFVGKVLKGFNNLSDGVKSGIAKFIGVVGIIGPVLLMTFGLIANGIANLIKLFVLLRKGYIGLGGQSKILGLQTNYMTSEQIEAATVAASLNQAHSKLQQVFMMEKDALVVLTQAYQRASAAAAVFARTNPGMMRPVVKGRPPVPPIKLGSGGFVPGKGNTDTVPAVLTPGEFIVNKEATQQNKGLLEQLNQGGYVKRLIGTPKMFARVQKQFLGMPSKNAKVAAERQTKQKQLDDISTQTYKSPRAKKIPLTDPGKRISPSSGHSFPSSSVGGIYEKPDGTRVFVKPMVSEKAALAEMRATQITRDVHGLVAPKQKLILIKDPSDPTGHRQYFALESKMDAKISKMPQKFTKNQTIKQLVASLLRGDKDLGPGNIGGGVVSDVGPAGVFDRASGPKTEYAKIMPSMEEQAMVNLLAVKGGAKKFFATTTASTAAKMSPYEYNIAIKKEINRILPKLKKTTKTMDLSPEELPLYQSMIARLEAGAKVDWSKFQPIHAAALNKSGLVVRSFGTDDDFPDLKHLITQSIKAKKGVSRTVALHFDDANSNLDERLYHSDKNSSKYNYRKTSGFTMLGPEGYNQLTQAMNKAGISLKNIAEPYPMTYEDALKTKEALKEQIRYEKKLYDQTTSIDKKEKIANRQALTRIALAELVSDARTIGTRPNPKQAWNNAMADRYALATSFAEGESVKDRDKPGSVYARKRAQYLEAINSNLKTTTQLKSRLQNIAFNEFNKGLLTDKGMDSRGSREERSGAKGTGKLAFKSPKGKEGRLGGLLAEDIDYQKQKILQERRNFQRIRGLMGLNVQEAGNSNIKIDRKKIDAMVRSGITPGFRHIRRAKGTSQYGEPATVPALVTPGEMILNEKTTQQYGPALQYVNSGGIIKMRGKGTMQNGLVPGTGNKDTVPIMLNEGSFVVNKDSTQKNKGFLNRIAMRAKGTGSKFVMRNSGTGGTQTATGIAVNVQDQKILSEKQLLEEEARRKKAAQRAQQDLEKAKKKIRTIDVKIAEATKVGDKQRLEALKQARQAALEQQKQAGVALNDARHQAKITRENNARFIQQRTEQKDQEKQKKAQEKALNKERGRQFGQRAGGAMMGTTMALGVMTQAPGKIGEISTSLLPVVAIASMLAPMIGSKAGAILAPIAAFGAAMVALRMQFDKAQDAALKLSKATGTSTEAIQNFALFSGRVTGTELLDKQRLAARGQLVAATGKTTFGEAFVQSEQGKALGDAFKENIKERGVKAARENLKAQLQTSVLSGAITAEEAQSIAANLGAKMGDVTLGIQVAGELQGIFGKDGKDIIKNGIQIRTTLMTESSQNLMGKDGSLDQLKKRTSGGFLGIAGLSQTAKTKGTIAAGAGLGAAAGVLTGVGASAAAGALGTAILGTAGGARVGAAVGSFAGPLGAVIGTAIGAIAGGAIAYFQNKKSMEKLGKLSGAAVADSTNMIEQSRQLLDSYEVEYKQRRAQLVLEGKIAEVKELDLKYEKNRAILTAQQIKQREDFVKAYATTRGNARTSMDTAIDKQITTKYKETDQEAYVDVAKEQTKEALKNKLILDEQAVLLKIQMASGEISPRDAMRIFSTFENKEDIQRVMTLLTKLGGDETSAAMEIVSQFQDSKGNPIPKLNSEFILQLSQKSDKDAQPFIEMMQKVVALGGVMQMDTEIDYILKNPEVQNEMTKDLKMIADNKGKPFTIEFLNKVNTEFEKTIDMEYFKKLSEKEQEVYVRTISTLLNINGEVNIKDDDFIIWLNQKRITYDKNSPTAILELYNKYRNEFIEYMGQKVTLARLDLSAGLGLGGQGSGSGGSTKKQRDTTFDEMNKKLKLFQQASVNALGNFQELKRVMNLPGKKGGAFYEFNGISQQLLQTGQFSKDFIDMIENLSPEELQKQLKKWGIEINKGVVTTKNAADLINKALSSIGAGQMHTRNLKEISVLQNRIAAINKLTKEGVDYEIAMSIAEEDSVAHSIKQGIVKKEQLNKLISTEKTLQKLQTKNQLIQVQAVNLKEIDILQNRIIAVNKLRKAGVDYATAMFITENEAVALSIKQGDLKTKQMKEIVSTAKTLQKIQMKNQQIEETKSKDPAAKEAGKMKKLIEFFDLEGKAIEAKNVIQKTAIELQQEKNGYLLEQITYEQNLISDVYDKQIKKLDELHAIQEQINQTQKERFDLAQQLASGDMAAAAGAIQAIRERQALAQIEQKKANLEKEKQKKLEGVTAGGKTQKQIEKENNKAEKDLSVIKTKEFDAFQKIRKEYEKILGVTIEEASALIDLESEMSKLGFGVGTGLGKQLLNALKKAISGDIKPLMQLIRRGTKDVNDEFNRQPGASDSKKIIVGGEIIDVPQEKSPLDYLNKDTTSTKETKSKDPAAKEADTKKTELSANTAALVALTNAIQGGGNNAKSKAKKQDIVDVKDILNNKEASDAREAQIKDKAPPTLLQAIAAANEASRLADRVNTAKIIEQKTASDAREAQIKDKASLTIAGVAQTLGAMGSRGAAGISSPTLQQVIAAANKAARLPDSAKAKQQDVADVARILAQKEAYQNIKIGKGKNEQKITVPKNFGMSSGGLVPKYMSKGGMTKPLYRPMGGLIPYFLGGGFAKGTDTVPAMLTPGEFVVQKRAVDKLGIGIMNRINQGELPANNNSAVYNYNLSVNVSNTNANPNDIARVVINQIKQIDSQRIRSSR
jgi:TP901 family phage tail tape measure protein